MSRGLTLKRIMYVQYTNPAAYPPLEHSSRILAEDGWQVLFLGTRVFGVETLDLAPGPNVTVRQVPFCPAGWRQKLHYLRYLRWNLAWARRFRPSWIYASDPLSTPIALLLARLPKVRVLYHEHDEPPAAWPSAFGRLILAARQRLAQRAAICVLPNERRLQRFLAATRRPGPTFCVWNCASRPEVGASRGALDGRLEVLYHGSLVPDRLPLTVLEALTLLPPTVRLRIAGYETAGARGYARALTDRAAELGLSERVSVLGALPSRATLLRNCRECDVGLALMPLESADGNNQSMVGASNKPFDYFASGLATLVSDLSDWRQAYVEPGYGLACRPDQPESIAASLRWCLEHPDETRTMGERGRQMVLTEWNYETRFSPVLASLGAGQRGDQRVV